MGLGLGDVLFMLVRWSLGLAVAVGVVVMIAWLGDRVRESVGRRGTELGAGRPEPADEVVRIGTGAPTVEDLNHSGQ